VPKVFAADIITIGKMNKKKQNASGRARMPFDCSHHHPPVDMCLMYIAFFLMIAVVQTSVS